jgi:hypothetical protein
MPDVRVVGGLVLVLLAGCGGSKSPVERVLLREGRVDPGVGVSSLKLGMSVQTVEKTFGKPSLRVVTPGGNTAMDLVYGDVGVRVIVRSDNGRVVRIVCGVPDTSEGMSFEGSTAQDVKVGSSAQTVARAYGPAPAQTATTLDYPELGIQFIMEEGRVVKMSVMAAKPAASQPQATAP